MLYTVLFILYSLNYLSCTPHSVPKRLDTQREGPTRLLPGLAGGDLIFQWIGMVEYIVCCGGLAEQWGPLPTTRLASRKILVEQNIKKRTGPALCVLCAQYSTLYTFHYNTLFLLYCTFFSSHSTLYTVHCNRYTVCIFYYTTHPNIYTL